MRRSKGLITNDFKKKRLLLPVGLGLELSSLRSRASNDCQGPRLVLRAGFTQMCTYAVWTVVESSCASVEQCWPSLGNRAKDELHLLTCKRKEV